MYDFKKILKSISNGDKRSFQILYNSFCNKIYNTSLSYLQNKQDAEEVMQDVFMKIHQKAATFKGESSVSTWIYKITVNTSLNFLKRKKRFSFFRISETEINKQDFEHPGILLENKERAKILFRTIDTLSDNQKTAFILSFIEGLPRQEVANIMAISLKATESLLQRAKKNLREKLNILYYNEGK
jgi:RNA polymerase sigma-70 factor (ECF subfamily)